MSRASTTHAPKAPTVTKTAHLHALRERARLLTWDPDELRAFLVDMIDALSPPAPEAPAEPPAA